MNGTEIITANYDSCHRFSDGLAAVWKNHKCSFIDTLGRTVFELDSKYSEFGDFHDGLAYVFVDGKVGYIDKTGRVVIAPSLDFAFYDVDPSGI